MDIYTLANNARAAAFVLMITDTSLRDTALHAIADALLAAKDYVLKQNELDMQNAAKKGMGNAMLDRLRLDEKRLADMAQGLRDVAALSDPLGVGELSRRPNGLMIEKRRVPLGVVGMIYEARPNVTIDAIGICIKSGNAVILRGGSEAILSNKALVTIVKRTLSECGLPESCVGLVEDTSREVALQMMRLNGYIDVLIPRGGAGLIATVVKNAGVPVIQTGAGNCHIYVDQSANLDMAAKIIYNAKCSRPAVCNATEKLLVHESVAADLFLRLMPELRAKGVEIRGCPAVCSMVAGAVPASEQDWLEEYDDYILGIFLVDGLDSAIGHINAYSTKHSEAIITENYTNAQRFLNEIDSAAVYVNASTRFTDGGEFGFGAEIGISTQKLHARGPMGLAEMTTVKYCIYGDGQVRQ